jgi:hypothetical protein
MYKFQVTETKANIPGEVRQRFSHLKLIHCPVLLGGCLRHYPERLGNIAAPSSYRLFLRHYTKGKK